MVNDYLLQNALDGLREANGISWFSEVGVTIPEANIIQVDNWAEALREYTSGFYRDIREKALQRFQSILTLRSPSGFADWPTIQQATEPVILELAHKVLLKIPVHIACNDLEDSIILDLYGYAMECSYIEMMPQHNFFGHTMYCYSKGHFPCGWKGELDSYGRRIIY